MKPFLCFLCGLAVAALALRAWEGLTQRPHWQCDSYGLAITDGLNLREAMAANEANLRLNRARMDAQDHGGAWLDSEKLRRAEGCQ